jgi:hypothetical protein
MASRQRVNLWGFLGSAPGESDEPVVATAHVSLDIRIGNIARLRRQVNLQSPRLIILVTDRMKAFGQKLHKTR